MMKSKSELQRRSSRPRLYSVRNAVFSYVEPTSTGLTSTANGFVVPTTEVQRGLFTDAFSHSFITSTSDAVPPRSASPSAFGNLVRRQTSIKQRPRPRHVHTTRSHLTPHPSTHLPHTTNPSSHHTLAPPLQRPCPPCPHTPRPLLTPHPRTTPPAPLSTHVHVAALSAHPSQHYQFLPATPPMFIMACPAPTHKLTPARSSALPLPAANAPPTPRHRLRSADPAA